MSFSEFEFVSKEKILSEMADNRFNVVNKYLSDDVFEFSGIDCQEM